MKISLNGTEKQYLKQTSLTEIVQQYSKTPSSIILELNGTVIQAERWKETSINEGDSIELLQFVGGG